MSEQEKKKKEVADLQRANEQMMEAHKRKLEEKKSQSGKEIQFYHL